jgi:hypothetical protein
MGIMTALVAKVKVEMVAAEEMEIMTEVQLPQANAKDKPIASEKQ